MLEDKRTQDTELKLSVRLSILKPWSSNKQEKLRKLCEAKYIIHIVFSCYRKQLMEEKRYAVLLLLCIVRLDCIFPGPYNVLIIPFSNDKWEELISTFFTMYSMTLLSSSIYTIFKKHKSVIGSLLTFFTTS